jgi:hypothetical protein
MAANGATKKLIQRDQDAKTKRSTVPHECAASFKAINFRFAKVSDTQLVTGLSTLLLSCEPIPHCGMLSKITGTTDKK